MTRATQRGAVVCVESREPDPADPNKLMAALIRAKSRWCATYRRTTMDGDEHVKTRCGYTVSFSGPLQVREPTCEECRRLLGLG